MSPEAIPMFPLGSVLLPGVLLPLHVFEQRYRALVHDVLRGDGRFGVTLIERGSEVGGGDQRTDVGTLARVLRAEEAPDGRWGLVAVGESRIRVRRWLEDDPYPRAMVDLWSEDADPVDAELVDRVASLLRRALTLCVELGDLPVPVPFEVLDDPEAASYQLSALAPLGPADGYRLLLAPGPARRLALLEELLVETIEVSTFRLGEPDR